MSNHIPVCSVHLPLVPDREIRPQFLGTLLDCIWNVMAHAQKSDFVFRRNGCVHLNRQGRQFSQLLAVEVCASAVVILDAPCSEVVWRVLATNTIRQFPLHFPSLRHHVPSHFNWTRPKAIKIKRHFWAVSRTCLPSKHWSHSGGSTAHSTAPAEVCWCP